MMRHLFALALALIVTQACSSHTQADAPAAGPVRTDGVASKNRTFLTKLAWTTGPVAMASAAARLSFTDLNDAEVKSVDGVAFYPWMTSMGHGTSMQDQKITPVAGTMGGFTVDGIYFVMGGVWDVRVTATVNGTTDTATIAVSIP